MKNRLGWTKVLFTSAFLASTVQADEIVDITPFYRAVDSVALGNIINDLYNDLTLPDTIKLGGESFAITWESSDTLFLTHDGHINGRFVGENKEVTLTATVQDYLSDKKQVVKNKVSIHGFEPYSNYLFAYFPANNDENIYYALSNDGYNFTPMNNGKRVVAADSVSIKKGLRDPHVLRAPDGWFYMVNTDMKSAEGWASNRGMVLMKSRDLIHWRHATVHFPEKYKGKNFANVTRVWAPETIWDENYENKDGSKGRPLVYYSLLTNDGTISYDQVFFNYANDDKRTEAADPIFAGIGGMTTQMGDLQALVMSGDGDEDLKLRLLDTTCNGAGGYYEMGADLKLRKVAGADSKAAADMRAKCRFAAEGVFGEKSSVLIVDDSGSRWRLPWCGWSSEGPITAHGRVCREICTERDMLNVGGTFYELPAENAGGYAKMRPIATHANPGICDYCTWRGLLVMTGLMRFGRPESARIVTESTAGVWLGVVDELWKFGKPRGNGGPWLDTPVKAGEASDPYLMTGYDRKTLTAVSDRDAKVKIEIDIAGDGMWSALTTLDLKAGAALEKDISAIRAYWVRAVSDADCTATLQFRYE